MASPNGVNDGVNAETERAWDYSPEEQLRARKYLDEIMQLANHFQPPTRRQLVLFLRNQAQRIEAEFRIEQEARTIPGE